MVKLYLSASFDSAGADGPLPDPKAIIPKVFAAIAKTTACCAHLVLFLLLWKL